MNGDADQIANTLKTDPGYPHRMPTTHADTINADLLTFIRS
jgi:non-heme chloroperoxidase